MALTIKFSITCCSWTRSPWTGGKPSANCVRTDTLLFAASARVRAITSRMASSIATASFRAGTFFNEGTNSLDDLARTITLLYGTSERLAHLAEIRWFRTHPAQGGLRVCDCRGDRLIHFMGDRGRELTHGGDA